MPASKTPPQMSLSEMESAATSAPSPYDAIIAELVRRLRDRIMPDEKMRQQRIDALVLAHLQSGDTSSASVLYDKADMIEQARVDYVTARIAGPSE